eukprot:363133-Chlamydomonas_euryale.AAC.6
MSASLVYSAGPVANLRQRHNNSICTSAASVGVWCIKLVPQQPCEENHTAWANPPADDDLGRRHPLVQLKHRFVVRNIDCHLRRGIRTGICVVADRSDRRTVPARYWHAASTNAVSGGAHRGRSAFHKRNQAVQPSTCRVPCSDMRATEATAAVNPVKRAAQLPLGCGADMEERPVLQHCCATSNIA